MNNIIDSSLLHIAGASFQNDPFVAEDLAHLRWSVDSRLGFPRRPFILERRKSIRVAEGRDGIKDRSVNIGAMKRDSKTGDLVSPLLRIATLPSGERVVNFRMESTGKRGGVCFVRLSFARGRRAARA